VIQRLQRVPERFAQHIDVCVLLSDRLADMAGIEADAAIAEARLSSYGAGETDGFVGIADAHPLHAEIELNEHVDGLVELSARGTERFDGRMRIKCDTQLHILREHQDAPDLGPQRWMREENVIRDLTHDLQLSRCRDRQPNCAEAELLRGHARRLVCLDMRAQRELMERSVRSHAIEISGQSVQINERDGSLNIGESIGHSCYSAIVHIQGQGIMPDSRCAVVVASVRLMPNLSRIARIGLASLSLIAGCREAPPARQEVSGDPATLKFAPSLKVNLDSTEKRPSGLYVRDLVVGTGAVCDSMSTAEVHYTGWLADGSEFDSSRKAQQTFRFTVGIGQVIQAWDEGLRGMRVGGKRQLIVPPKLGYGDIGMAPIIPRMATLIFEVELIGLPPASPTSLR
jgi:FKBP-type peptidyl-prolyl cis-trans isomerase FkpA